MLKIKLDGIWDFYYFPQKFTPGKSPLPERKLFTGRMIIPGYWDDHYELFDEEDFFSLEARFNPDYRKPHFPAGHTLLPHASSSFLIGTGCYHRIVNQEFAPESQIILHVGPAMWGCAVYCNSHLVDSESGYSVARDFNLTSYFKSGADNEIIIAVCNVHDDGGAYCRVDGSHDGIPFGARPGQHRGLAAQGYQSERAGIGDSVSLLITGKTRVVDHFISFEGELPRWHVELDNGIGSALKWRIADEEEIIDCGEIICESNQVEFTSQPLPQKWSDRNPKLYHYELQINDDVISGRCGSRQVKCIGTGIFVNGKKTYFRGATEHCYFPESCNPHFDKAKYLHDLTQFKKAGFNFIRCHTWCPPEQFYEACDELGFFVQTELPSVYTFHEAELIVKMIRRHACAVIFCEGNEKQINGEIWERMKQLFILVRQWAPGMLINPQEAMRGVEYGFVEGRTITQLPFPHDAERFAQIAPHVDLYGSLSGGYFSYEHDTFPGVEQVEYEHSIYKKPCLSHEIGILGGYLDFSLENRYQNTFIGQDMFKAVREYMKKNNIYKYAEKYYQNNCRFISSIRKQLIENLRSCPSIAGYDYLGGIDTHWHLTGYPCGMLNEFYEEKYGETFADLRRYNGESVLLCSGTMCRNHFAGTVFKENILFSYYGEDEQPEGVIEWSFRSSSKEIVASGKENFKTVAGSVSIVAQIDFPLPECDYPFQGILQVYARYSGEVVENHWDFWIFPRKPLNLNNQVKCANLLTDDLINFVANGGKLLLTGNFPSITRVETFRPHTSGRTLGHAGMLIHPHPVWKHFPNEGFGDWQFFRMMSGSSSIVYDTEMPEYKPLFELIPSFKLIRRKSMLSEFQVDKGRIIMSGFVFDDNDPAGSYLKSQIVDYLSNGKFADAPQWDAVKLREKCRKENLEKFTEVQIDEGGRAK